jgi:hypothetical protein
MAKAKRLMDEFPQPYGLEGAFSGTGGGQYNTQISSAYSTKDRVGMIIHWMEYDYSRIVEELNGDIDAVRFGLSTVSEQSATGHRVNTPGVIDFNRVTRSDKGTAGNAVAGIFTITKDFSNLPRTGVLVHPAFLYWWSHAEASLADTGYVNTRILYTVIPLSDADYMDLWQNMIITSTI